MFMDIHDSRTVASMSFLNWSVQDESFMFCSGETQYNKEGLLQGIAPLHISSPVCSPCLSLIFPSSSPQARL